MSNNSMNFSIGQRFWDRKQFILCRFEPKANGKTDKIPISNTTFTDHSAFDPAIQGTYEEIKAMAAMSPHGWGVGFVFTENDPYCLIDIDDCLQPDGHQWSQLANDLCARFAGCYVEVSQSGKGLHIICSISAPIEHSCKNTALGLEMYHTGRFVALTGTRENGNPDQLADASVRWVVDTYLQPKANGICDVEWTDGPCPEYTPIPDDLDLVNKMLSSKSAAGVFNSRATIRDLWIANPEALGKFFPDPSGMRPFDNSSADAALCQHLAFWTGKDCERMDRIFRMSSLYRDKWDAREDYRKNTVLKAVSMCANVYTGGSCTEQTQCPPRPDAINGMTAREIMFSDFKDPIFAVPGIIPEGLSILAGKPKKGKSILAMNLCIVIASGSLALGNIPVTAGHVIYLALEDNFRRLKKRLVHMGAAPSDRLRIFTEWPRMPEGLQLLDAEMGKYPDLKLVVVDTFAKFRPVGNGSKNTSVYDLDYQHMGDIKSIADKHSVAILCIHHLRKTESDDVFDTLNGSFGLSGAADGLIALVRKSGQADAVLHVTGRDLEPVELALSFNCTTLSWVSLGNAADVKSTNERQRLYDALKDGPSPVSPKMLAEATGLRLSYVYKTLPILKSEGVIQQIDRGLYKYIGKDG